jgi:hypothetical protein
LDLVDQLSFGPNFQYPHLIATVTRGLSDTEHKTFNGHMDGHEQVIAFLDDFALSSHHTYLDLDVNKVS